MVTAVVEMMAVVVGIREVERGLGNSCWAIRGLREHFHEAG